MRLCSTTPRFSYEGPKYTVLVHVLGMTVVRGAGVYGRGMGTGWVLGGYRGGLYRVLPTHRARTALYSEAGPVGPCRGRSGWYRAGTRDRRLDGYLDPPSGPGRACCPPWSRNPRNAASWPIKARFHYISYKVSQKARVSPKSVEKACHSP